jgi:hypothetical protein
MFYRHAVIHALTSLLLTCPVTAQGLKTAPLPSSTRTKTPSDVERDNPRVLQIMEKAEQHYKLGELNLKDKNMDAARTEFDKAVDSVLESGMDVRSNPKLQTFYLELVERVSRMEVAMLQAGDAQAPQFIAASTNATNDVPVVTQQPGFVREQKFEPSPLDELAKLELIGEEGGVAGPPGGDAEVCRTGALRGVSLRGFTLGMSEAEVRRRLPRLQTKAGPRGMRSASVFFVGKTNPPPAELKGVALMGFDFLEGRAARVAVGYDASIKWDSLEEFTRHTGEALRLPAVWRAHRGLTDNLLRSISCDDAAITITFASPSTSYKAPIIILEDSAAFDLARRRAESAAEQRRQAEERKKQTFKP